MRCVEIAIRSRSLNGYKQRARLHSARVVGHLGNPQFRRWQGRKHLHIQQCQADRQHHRPFARSHTLSPPVITPGTGLVFRFVGGTQSCPHGPFKSFSYFCLPGLPADAPNSTMIFEPCRTFVPASGVCCEARLLPTSTGSSPNRRHSSVTSRIVFPVKSGTAIPPSSSAATISSGNFCESVFAFVEKAGCSSSVPARAVKSTAANSSCEESCVSPPG